MSESKSGIATLNCYHNNSSSSSIIISHMLPDDLVIEILLRLPVKSILRFNCVSKSWNLLLSSDEFRKKYRVVSKSRNLLNWRLMFRDKYTRERKHYALLDDAAAAMVMLDSPAAPDTRRKSPSLTCVASGDGLLLFALDKIKLMLLNPSTGKFRQLPKFLSHNDASGVDCDYGLGFDESSHQFKVIVFVYNPPDLYNVVVKIYGLEDKGTWRKIKNHNGFILYRNHNQTSNSTLCANGKIHWIVQPILPNNQFVPSPSWQIAYLDLNTEEYGIVDKLEFVPRRCGYVNLVSSQGSIYVFCQQQCYGYADVWMIEPGYGQYETSWTRVVRIPLEIHRDVGQKKLLYVWGDGPQVLFSCGSRFAIFNNKDSSFTYPDMAKTKSKPFTYIESLISP